MNRSNLSFLFLVLVIFIPVVVAGVSLTLSRSSPHYENLPPAEAHDLVQSGEAAVLDVRTPAEYEENHIPEALLHPVRELENKTINLSKERPLVVYCQSGYRSRVASAILVERGYEEVYNMVGGILAWRDAGLPLVENGKVVDTGVGEGDLAPDFTVTCTDGTTYSFENRVAHVTIVSFFLSSCGPCQDEASVLEKTLANHQDLGIISISPEKESAVQEFKEKENLSWFFASSEQVSDGYGVAGYPTLFVIDENGIVRRKYLGSVPYQELSATVENLSAA